MTSNKLKHKAKLQEWSLAVQECRSSGKPVKQWCSENKIKVTTYYRWEREILGTAGKSRNKPEHDGTAVFAELPSPMGQYRKVSGKRQMYRRIKIPVAESCGFILLNICHMIVG